ncbi:hypothetical protein SAY87_031784 [Trapa incisa]|uniref:Protein kinase domain-containing protein n=1 Tax=Trapa incisa TaxID=236973 RepID=A0AAN7KQB3_9MYRT|nr:hypothetical protein SAY87_031784 [Trapa incisa]
MTKRQQTVLPRALPIFLHLVILLLPQIKADISSNQQAILVFNNSIPHKRRLNWSTSSLICSSWVGVTCDSRGSRVTSLRLPGIGLIGPVPPNTIGKLDGLVNLSLRSNRLSGALPSDILSLPSLTNVYLQNNNFSGLIPSNFSSNLSIIDLAFNSFTGEIPHTVQNLTHLTVLYLQNNSLTGPIPDLDGTQLKYLNLSYNSLNGSIPPSLRRFPPSSFEGNTLLCGAPLRECASVSPSPSPSPEFPSVHPKPSSKRKLNLGIIIAIAAGGLALLCLLLVIIVLCCLKRKKKKKKKKKDLDDGPSAKGKSIRGEKSEEFGSGVQSGKKSQLVYFEGCSHNFDLEDLLKASAEVLGKGTCGTTYKAILEDGTTVVVKRLKEIIAEKKEFEQQMETIQRVGNHPNVIPLRAYYYSKDEKLLIYDFIAGGSFSSLLHGSRGTPLDWGSRVKICLGVAKGVAHIHSGGGKFIHGNIKSSNILLSQDQQGCISEFGLSPMIRCLVVPPRHAGYRAPEVMKSLKPSQKSDVYSFGVLLLEMLTGKSPVQSPRREDVFDLPRWVQSVVREEWTAEVFDEELLKDRNIEEEELVEMLKIALACVSRMADSRPTMEEVVRLIEDIRLHNSENLPSSSS